MPNRSTLPAVYVDSPTDWNAPDEPQRSYTVEMYDVTHLHFHNTLELGLCISGYGTCYVEQESQSFSVGDVQVLFPFQRHLSKSGGTEGSAWFWLNVDPLRVLLSGGFTDMALLETLLRQEMGLYGIFRAEEHPQIVNLVRSIILTNANRETHAHREAYLCSALYQLLLLLSDASRDLPKLALRTDPHFPLLFPALSHIRRELDSGRKPSVAELSALCGMSEVNFRRLFGRAIGRSPRQYIRACSMRKARDLLLQGGMSILDIGLCCGFEDISGFNRAFLSENGMTPSAYRALAKAQKGGAG